MKEKNSLVTLGQTWRKAIVALVGLMLTTSACDRSSPAPPDASESSPSNDDTNQQAAVKNTVEQFVRAWSSGDESGMSRVLGPSYRQWYSYKGEPRTTDGFLNSELLAKIRETGGIKLTWKVLSADVHQDVGSVRVHIISDFVDYTHNFLLVRADAGWLIVGSAYHAEVKRQGEGS